MTPYLPLTISINRWINTKKQARGQKRGMYRIFFIDHTRKLIYVENPKAASRTILSLFPSVHMAGTKRLQNSIPGFHITLALPSFKGWIPHIYTWSHKGCTHETRDWVTNKEKTTYTFFTFVRNPFDRAVSGFTNKIISDTPIAVPQHYHVKSWFDVMQTQREVANTPEGFRAFIDRYIVTKQDAHIDVHFKSQHRMTHDFMPEDRSFIGKVESFTEDWNMLATQHALPTHKGEKHNASKNKKPFETYYVTPDVIEKIYARYEHDCTLFGYTSTYTNLRNEITLS